jgi:hypothetical protein
MSAIYQKGAEALLGSFLTETVKVMLWTSDYTPASIIPGDRNVATVRGEGHA